MLLILDIVENAKLCKYNRVSDCPLSCLEQFLAPIPRYIWFTYSINNDFKLILGRVNFITSLNHYLHVSLTLIALMTNKAFIIQRTSFRGFVNQLVSLAYIS